MTTFGVFDRVPDGVQQFESWVGQPVDHVLSFLTGGNWSTSWSTIDIASQVSSGNHGTPGSKAVWSIPMYPDGGGVAALREIAAGQHIADHTRWAQEFLASRAGDNDPIYIRPNWQIGGEWLAWTADAQQDPGAYVAASQQFAQAFHNVSGRFKIVWDFASDRGAVEQFYPGDNAVDVISTNVYWNPQWTGADPRNAFAWVQSGSARDLDWMAEFAAQHGKPMAISEFGVPGRTDWTPVGQDPARPVAPQTYDGATFITLLKEWVSTHNVAYVNYWNGLPESGYDGRLSDGDPPGSAEALKLFALHDFALL